MKVHYINIFLLAIPLNILVTLFHAHNHRNHKKTILCKSKTKPTKTHRTLCECELYAPSNYKNDQEMKEVMDNFYHQTSERFREYDERVQDKRKRCKEQYEKDIQKIILKDKIEKQLAQQFSTLQINIDANDIPTCVCEKSMADKTEKVCLNCGKTMGAVAPAWGFVSGIGYVAWTQYVAANVLEEGIKKGIEVGLDKIAYIVTKIWKESVDVPKFKVIEFLSSGYFTDKMSLFDINNYINTTMSSEFELGEYARFSLGVQHIAEKSTLITKSYPTQVAAVTNAVIEGKTEAINVAAPATNALNTSIIASVVSIVVIILVMLIIYLILRYRRKKKMKKKLQYIKFLKE
ncbi:PIR protein [Plasmodium sp.]|nr:PIR protein [Plasmodium sp.]